MMMDRFHESVIHLHVAYFTLLCDSNFHLDDQISLIHSKRQAVLSIKIFFLILAIVKINCYSKEVEDLRLQIDGKHSLFHEMWFALCIFPLY